jgi:hypothetical protein
MEPYPFHYSRRASVEEPINSNNRFVLEELQKMEERLKYTI